MIWCKQGSEQSKFHGWNIFTFIFRGLEIFVLVLLRIRQAFYGIREIDLWKVIYLRENYTLWHLNTRTHTHTHTHRAEGRLQRNFSKLNFPCLEWIAEKLSQSAKSIVLNDLKSNFHFSKSMISREQMAFISTKIERTTEMLPAHPKQTGKVSIFYWTIFTFPSMQYPQHWSASLLPLFFNLNKYE